MKRRLQILSIFGVATLLGAPIWFFAANSTLFLNSKLGRLWENDLPRITMEDQRTVYCRMKADDFRFSLPSDATVVDLEIKSGGFDKVEGRVRVKFPPSKGMSARETQEWLRRRLQVGGWITAEDDPNSSSILISFSYFGDR